MPRELVPLNQIPSHQALLFTEAIDLSVVALESYEKRRLQEIYDQLDQKLLRPQFLRRLLTGGQSRFTPLCAEHKPLNASPIHSIFLLIQLEVGVRLNGIVQAGRDRVGSKLWSGAVLNVRSLHGLWMPDGLLAETFQDSMKLNYQSANDDLYYRKWQFESSGCEACMIRTIIEDPETLFDLSALCRSRIPRNSSKSKLPRLLTWISLWVARCVEKLHLIGRGVLAEKYLKRADELADELYWKRKEIRKHGRNCGGRNQQKATSPDCSRSSSTHTVPQTLIPLLPSDRKHINSQRDVKNVGPSRISSIAQSPPFQELHEESDVSDIDEDVPYQHSSNPSYESYAALISTPFLLGMDLEQHKRAEASLSRIMHTQAATPNILDCHADREHGKRCSHRQIPVPPSQDMVTARITRSPLTNTSQRNSQLEARRTRASNLDRLRQSDMSYWTDISVPPSESDMLTSCFYNTINPRFSQRQYVEPRDQIFNDQLLDSRDWNDRSRTTHSNPYRRPKQRRKIPQNTEKNLDEQFKLLKELLEDLSQDFGITNDEAPADKPYLAARISRPFNPAIMNLTPGTGAVAGRPFSDLSQQTTWTRMCRQLSISEGDDHWSKRSPPWEKKN